MTRGSSFRTFSFCPSTFALITSVLNIDYLGRPEALEKAPGLDGVELRIRRLDHEEERVLARALEPGVVEHRVVRPRQTIQGEHAEHRRERRNEDGQFERRRNPGHPRVQGPAAD